MTARRAGRRPWFLPAAPDVMGLLAMQAQTTLEGMTAFERWAGGEAGAGEEVRSLEHAADAAKRAALSALQHAFVTPVEPEDLFELSERLDRVMNQAKDLVREAEVLGMAPDPPTRDMAALALAGVRALASALAHLADDTDTATQAADEAIRQQRAMERVYRQAMSELLRSNDAREVGGRRELYRRCSRLGVSIEHVADRIWYAVVKRR